MDPEVRILAMTIGGLGAAGVVMAATALAARAVFEKPFESSEVLGLVASTLNEKAPAPHLEGLPE